MWLISDLFLCQYEWALGRGHEPAIEQVRDHSVSERNFYNKLRLIEQNIVSIQAISLHEWGLRSFRHRRWLAGEKLIIFALTLQNNTTGKSHLIASCAPGDNILWSIERLIDQRPDECSIVFCNRTKFTMGENAISCFCIESLRSIEIAMIISSKRQCLRQNRSLYENLYLRNDLLRKCTQTQ